MANLWTFGDSYTAGHGCKFQPSGIFSRQNTNSSYYKMYSSYIDDTKKIWPEIVAESFGLQLNNLGNNGSSTETILDIFIKNISNIQKEDVVLIQTSMAARWDFPFLKEKTLFGLKDYKLDTELFDCTNSPYRFKVIFPANIEEEWNESMEDVLNYTNGQETYGESTLKLNKQKYETIRNFFVEFISLNKYYERTMWRIVELVTALRTNGYRIYMINEDEWPMYLSKPNFLIDLHERGLYGYCSSKRKTIFYDTHGEINDWHPDYDGHQMIADDIINFLKNENINIHNT